MIACRICKATSATRNDFIQHLIDKHGLHTRVDGQELTDAAQKLLRQEEEGENGRPS